MSLQGPANYNWEYAVVDDKYNDFGHKETRDGYQATGKYYVNLPDGRTQVQTYDFKTLKKLPLVLCYHIFFISNIDKKIVMAAMQFLCYGILLNQFTLKWQMYTIIILVLYPIFQFIL